MFRFQAGFRAPVIVSRDGGTKAHSPSQSFRWADDCGSPRGMLEGGAALVLPLSTLRENSLCPGSHERHASQGEEAMESLLGGSGEVRCAHSARKKK